MFVYSTEQLPFTGQKAAKGQGCPRCGFPVYAAEQMHSKNGSWHKRCFSCADCHRSLVSKMCKVYTLVGKINKEQIKLSKTFILKALYSVCF